MKTHGAIPYSRAEIEARFDDSEHWKRILAGLEAHEALQASYENLNTVRGILSERMLAYVSKADQAETALQELKTILNDALEASYFEDDESDWKERAKALLSATPASDHVVASEPEEPS